MIVLARGDVVLPDRVLSEGIDRHRRGDASRPSRRVPWIRSGPRPSTPATATSCPDSSTCTCTASRVRHARRERGRCGNRRRGFRATASRPSARRRSRVRLRSSAVFLNQVRDRTSRAPFLVGPRAARASRKQLHQPRLSRRAAGVVSACAGASASEGDFSARDILDTIAASRPDVGIVTLAPEAAWRARSGRVARRVWSPGVAGAFRARLRHGHRRHRGRRAGMPRTSSTG